MTTQELIEKINKIAIETPFPNSKIVDHLEVIKLIEQLEEAGFGEVFNSTLFEVEEVEEVE